MRVDGARCFSDWLGLQCGGQFPQKQHVLVNAEEVGLACAETFVASLLCKKARSTRRL